MGMCEGVTQAAFQDMGMLSGSFEGTLTLLHVLTPLYHEDILPALFSAAGERIDKKGKPLRQDKKDTVQDGQPTATHFFARNCSNISDHARRSRMLSFSFLV